MSMHKTPDRIRTNSLLSALSKPVVPKEFVTLPPRPVRPVVFFRRAREAGDSRARAPPPQVDPRPAQHHFSVSHVKRPLSALSALKHDRLQFSLRRQNSEASVMGNTPYADPQLYSYGSLPPMLHRSNRPFRANTQMPPSEYGIHPVDSVDVTHPSSLTNQTKYRVKVKPWENRSLAMISAISDGEQTPSAVAPWDSTVRQTNIGLWRPPERHRAV